MTAPSSADTLHPHRSEWPLLLFLTAASVGIRLALALRQFNYAEYTDGVLQLTLFSRGNPYWPALYSALAVSLGNALGDLELGGRLVSAIIGGLAILPICLIAQRLNDHKATALTGVVFLVLPEPLRWGIRVMTDATFLTLFATAILLLLPRREEPIYTNSQLFWATVVSVLATLTRYQGLLLLIPILYAMTRRGVQRQSIAPALVAQMIWLLIPLWIFRGGFAHLRQFADRSGADLGLTTGQTLLAYWNLAESYIYLFPYSISFGVFIACLGGIFYLASNPRSVGNHLLGFFLFSAIVLLAAQAAFGIFEFRYLLPLLAFIVPFAGVGLQRIDAALVRHRLTALVVFCVVLLPPMFLSIGSLVLQREAFFDIKLASEFAARVATAETKIYTNEHYNNEIPVVKTEFWAKRPVLFDPEFARFQYMQIHRDPFNPPPPVPKEQRFNLGDLIIFNTIYAGPPPAEILYLSYLGENYEFDTIQQYHVGITPLLTDLMEVPYAHGSPLAWFYRYQLQSSQTLVLKITKIKMSD